MRLTPIEEMHDMLNVTVYRHPDEFPSDVQQLFAIGELKSVESSSSWYRNLVNSVYASDAGVHIYILWKNGHPVAALPLRVKKTSGSQHIESLSNYYTSLYTPLIEIGVEVRDMLFLINAVMDAHAPLGSLRFSPMAPESTDFHILLGALQASGLVPFKFFCFGNWSHQVSTNWTTYLRNREGSVRNTIKRMTKKFAVDGGTLELVQGGANLDRGLAAYERVYASSWKKPEPYPEFIPGLIRTCAERGWLRLGIAWLNDEPIAAQLWIVANGKANIYKLAYDENFKSYASGTLLTAMLMEYAIDKDRVLKVDYLIGDDAYKKSWMSHRRERWGIIAYNPKTPQGLVGLGRERLGRMLRTLLVYVKTRMHSVKK